MRGRVFAPLQKGGFASHRHTEMLTRVALIWILMTVTGAVVPTCGLPDPPLFMLVGAIVVGRVCDVNAAMTADRKASHIQGTRDLRVGAPADPP
jgi:hypothetical protein